jgi:hypothetical protein
MNDEELLTKQADMVLSKDPGMAGGQPRVWVYRETIQALNFFTSVREKLDDPGTSPLPQQPLPSNALSFPCFSL